MNKHVYASIALAVGLGLSGCGGGGDGATASPKALVPLAAANYDGIAEESTSSVASNDELFSTVESFSLARAASAHPSSVALLASGRLDAMALFALSQVDGSSSGRVKSAAVETATEACGFAGSLSIVANDADNNNVTSVGDVVTLTASNCVPAEGEMPINGSLSVSVRSASVNGLGDLTSGALEITFGNFTSNGLTLNGQAVLSVSASTLVLDFNGLTASYGSQIRVYDYALTANRSGNTLSVAGPITVNNSTYVLATPAVLQYSAGHPAAGTLRITDGHGNRVDVAMASTTYTASLYLAGDEGVDASATHPW